VAERLTGVVSQPETSPRIGGRARTAVALATTLLLWASAFAGIRVGLKVYAPGHLALLRYLVASAVLAAIWSLGRRALPERRDLPGIALMGLLGFTIYNAALNYGEVTVTAGAASFLVNTAPVFTVILAILFLGERLTLAGWIGIAISFAGATVIAFAEGGGFHFSRGALWILVSALAASGYTILQKRYLSRYGALALITYVIWAGTFFLLVFAPGLVSAVRAAPLNATLGVIYLGVFPGALAYVTWAHVLAKIPASVAVSFIYIVPVLTVVIAYLWLGEVPQNLSLLGGALALVGVVVVNTKGR